MRGSHKSKWDRYLLQTLFNNLRLGRGSIVAIVMVTMLQLYMQVRGLGSRWPVTAESEVGKDKEWLVIPNPLHLPS